MLFAGDLGAFVNLSGTLLPLGTQPAPKARCPRRRTGMWELALHLEEGQTEHTARALEQARQAARDAMDKAQQRAERCRTARSCDRS